MRNVYKIGICLSACHFINTCWIVILCILSAILPDFAVFMHIFIVYIISILFENYRNI